MTAHGTVTVDFSVLLLDTLGFTDDEFASVGGYQDRAEDFRTAVKAPADAVSVIPLLPTDANIYFGINPVKGPARENSGRGTEADVTRLSALWCELDVKPGACPSLDVARAIIAEVGIILGTRPSVTVLSGHGLHAYWPVSDGHIHGEDITAARALARRFGRLVAVVADRHNVHVDSVYDLARMLRPPGTFNNKNLNGQGPIPVIAHAEGGGPLTVAEVDERLTEVGIDEQDEDHQGNGAEVSAPAEWVWAEQTCRYVATMIERWSTDTPIDRHPWLMSQSIRLACAHRLGCITEGDYRRGRQVLKDRFTELVRTTEPRREPRRFEIEGRYHSAREYGITKAAAKPTTTPVRNSATTRTPAATGSR